MPNTYENERKRGLLFESTSSSTHVIIHYFVISRYKLANSIAVIAAS